MQAHDISDDTFDTAVSAGAGEGSCPATGATESNEHLGYRRTNLKQVFLQALSRCFGHWMKGQRSTERYKKKKKKKERKEKAERQKDKWKGKRKKK